MLPTGNGYFIWLLERAAGGDPVSMAQIAKHAGLSWVAIKIADGPSSFNIKPSGDLVGPAVQAFRDQGIAVYGWSYVYGYNPVGEAKMAALRTKQFALDGYIIDAESEYKVRPQAAEPLMQTLRKELPGFPLGICSFRFPTYHPEFPWKTFESCDFNMPQVYWMMARNAGQQLYRSYQEFQKLSPAYAKMPFMPIGAAFSEWGWAAQSAEVADFRTEAKALNVPAYGWWEWYDATVRHPDLWVASTNVIGFPPSPKIVGHYMTRYANLRIRKGPSLNAEILGFMMPNSVYTVYEKQDVWGKIAPTSDQWVHLGYCVKVS